MESTMTLGEATAVLRNREKLGYGEYRAACPLCSTDPADHRTTLSVTKDMKGVIHYACFRGCDEEDVRQEVNRRLAGQEEDAGEHHAPQEAATTERTASTEPEEPATPANDRQETGAGSVDAPLKASQFAACCEDPYQMADLSWIAMCPAHPDSERSLRVADGPGSLVRLVCVAGCETDAIVEAMLARHAPPHPAPPPKPDQRVLVLNRTTTDRIRGAIRAIEAETQRRIQAGEARLSGHVDPESEAIIWDEPAGDPATQDAGVSAPEVPTVEEPEWLQTAWAADLEVGGIGVLRGRIANAEGQIARWRQELIRAENHWSVQAWMKARQFAPMIGPDPTLSTDHINQHLSAWIDVREALLRSAADMVRLVRKVNEEQA